MRECLRYGGHGLLSSSLGERTPQLRPMRPRDAEILQTYIRGLSLASRHNRFLGTLNELSPAELRRWCDPNPARQDGLLIDICVDGDQQMIAEARYAIIGDGSLCEIALSVADRWQRRGVGTLLLNILGQRAMALGVQTIVADALRGNAPVKALARKSGFAITPDITDARLVRLTKVIGRPLAGDAPAAAA